MAFKSLAANDIFISYARKDATTYANGLADELTNKNFSCFTDRLGTDAGERLPPALLRELKNCGMLVLLCTEAAKESAFVAQEVEEYIEAKGTTRTIVPVIFDQTTMKAGWYSSIKGIAPEFEDPRELVTGDPSQAVISRIEKSFNYSRSKERLRRYTITAGALLSVFLLLSVAAFLFARTQLKAANEAQEEAKSQILSANSLSNLQVDPELSLLLAAKAAERPNPQSEAALKRALIESHLRAALQGHTDTIYDAEFSPDGKLIATASKDGTARVWEVSTGRVLKELKEAPGTSNEDGPPTVRVAKFSHDGESLLVSGSDGMVRIWETVTWQPVFAFRVSNRQVNDATFSPDDKHILTGSGSTVRVWDAGTRQMLKEVGGFSSGIDDVSLSADGNLIVVSEGEGVSVFDASSWQPVAQFKDPQPFEEFSAALSPDGKLVLVTGSPTPWLWEVGTRKKVAELHGHTAPVQRAKFSADGQFVLTVSEDSTARVWDTENWRSVLVLRGHKDMLFAAAFSPDGKSSIVGAQA